MATTTTAFTACDWVLELDDDLGAVQDISGSSNNCDVNFDNKISEFRVFGDVWTHRIACGKDAGFKVKGLATTGAAEIRELIESWFFNGNPNVPRTFRLSQPGGTSGNKRYSAEVLLKSFKFSGDAASSDPVMYDIEFVPTGEVTRTTIP